MMISRCAASLLSLCLISSLVGCGSDTFKSRDLRFTLQESPTIVKENGAVIVNKRQVGQLLEDGKLVDNRGRPLAWLHGKTIRLRGGVTLEIREDPDGTLSLSKSAQEKAGLSPVTYQVRPDGTMASTKNARGIEIQGAHIPRNRHLVLLLLVLDANNMWSGDAPAAKKPADSQPVADDTDADEADEVGDMVVDE